MSKSPPAGRYVCIHGHFYQPPRENPWLEVIEPQPSAHPYRDWNRRITAECYAPNAQSRILDAQGRVARVVNNYSRISFNFGPTLLSWLEDADPPTYRAILRADKESRSRFSGHGSAIAQAYNHAILPLCNSRDRRTQVVWGSADFRSRFDRPPEGMWLPETAVDLASLEVLAELGIRFTILAPSQAARFRPLQQAAWVEVGDAGIDPRRPYRLGLPSGRSIDLFFYDGPISQEIAFARLLDSGDRLIRRLVGGYDGRAGPQLVHVATDGETYGHHHAHGDMALAFALHAIEERGLARLTSYAEYLRLHPAQHEVQIREGSSWSCPHGVGRWSEDCGCAAGHPQGRHQRWRAPLREALDWLRDRLVPAYEQRASRHLRDPWEARDDYIRVVLDRGSDSVEAFFDRHARRRLEEPARAETLRLLELQRHAMLMYTSCGWFFEDISRIESIQILRYADRALQLAEALFEQPLEEEFVRRLERAPSNDPEIGHGGHLYHTHVRTARPSAS